MQTNELTRSLAPYPMEELRKIRREYEQQGLAVYDFGTGDPKIPVWSRINEEIRKSIPSVSQYPSIVGEDFLMDAHLQYLERRLKIDSGEPGLAALPTRGSKEAIFHIALSLVERGKSGRHIVVYPSPGYPVYRSSVLFSGGSPLIYQLTEANSYLIEPWTLPPGIYREIAAIWINYPHNPTGKVVSVEYLERLVSWCQEHDVLLLSDECYLDIYDEDLQPPVSPLSLSRDNVLGFFSLSKRSGLTGHRVGMLAGDARIVKSHQRARANFGLGVPNYIQAGAAIAWNDDDHVAERRRIFRERLEVGFGVLKELGLMEEIPSAGFYLWARVPKEYKGRDVDFCIDLARKGVLCTPSSWLGEGCSDYFRMAMVPDLEDTVVGMGILREFVLSL